MLKKYIMRGVTSARTQFKLGDFTANVEFKDGDVIHGIAASVITNDPRVQMAIENDEQMFGRVVFLEWKSGKEEEPGNVLPQKKTIALEDVKTIDDVKAYLIEHHNMPRTLSKIDTIKAKCEEFELVFPNFKFE